MLRTKNQLKLIYYLKIKLIEQLKKKKQTRKVFIINLKSIDIIFICKF